MRNTGICLVAMVLGALALAGCSSRESADWKSATAADTPKAYQQFLQQHPKSANALQAQARLQQIADDRDWQAAAAADTRDAYEQFVGQHADSKWAQEARIRIENFAQSGAAGGKAAPAPAVTATPSDTLPAAKPATIPPPAKVATAKPSPANSAAPRHAVTASSQAASGSEHGHFAQLGAFRTRARAESEWKTLSAKYPAELKSLKPHYIEVKAKGATVYKLRVGMSSVTEARGLCAKLKKHAQVCVPVTA